MTNGNNLPPRGKKCPAKPGQRITFILTDRKPFHHATLEDAQRERAYLTAKHKKEFRLLKVLNVSSDEVKSGAAERILADHDSVRAANERIGFWLSGALEDPAVCAEMKADIRLWFDTIEPPSLSALKDQKDD